MTEPILINETCETINKLSKEGNKLPIVIINNKRYAECYNGAYYISLEEKEKCGNRFIGKGMEITEDYIYRIYKINPKTNKLEMGGHIQYVENLDRSNPKDTCWIGKDVKLYGKVTVCHNVQINNENSFFMPLQLDLYLRSQNNEYKSLSGDLDKACKSADKSIGLKSKTPNSED